MMYYIVSEKNHADVFGPDCVGSNTRRAICEYLNLWERLTPVERKYYSAFDLVCKSPDMDNDDWFLDGDFDFIFRINDLKAQTVYLLLYAAEDPFAKWSGMTWSFDYIINLYLNDQVVITDSDDGPIISYYNSDGVRQFMYNVNIMKFV